MRPGTFRPDKFASQSLFSDPTPPAPIPSPPSWNATLAKTAITLAGYLQGFLPGRSRAIDRENWLWNMFGTWIMGHDAYEVQNFRVAVNGKTSNVHTEKLIYCDAPQTIAGIAPIEGRHWLFGTAASNSDVWVSNSGENWVSETTFSLSSQLLTDAATDGTTAHILAVTHGGALYQVRIAGSWSTLSIASSDSSFCVVWSPAYSKFFAGAVQGAGTTPAVVTVNQALTASAKTNLAHQTGYPGSSDTNGIQILACNHSRGPGSVGNGSLLVGVLGGTGGSFNLAGFYSSDGATWAAWSIATAQQATDLFWDDSQQLFYLLDVTGHVFSSPTGAVWIDTGVVVNLDTSKSRTCSVYGSIWAMVLNSNVCAYSTDQGAHWTTIPHPFTCGAGEVPQYTVQRISRASDGRFVILAQALTDTAAGQVSWSGRAI